MDKAGSFQAATVSTGTAADIFRTSHPLCCARKRTPCVRCSPRTPCRASYTNICTIVIVTISQQQAVVGVYSVVQKVGRKFFREPLGQQECGTVCRPTYETQSCHTPGSGGR